MGWDVKRQVGQGQSSRGLWKSDLRGPGTNKHRRLVWLRHRESGERGANRPHRVGRSIFFSFVLRTAGGIFVVFFLFVCWKGFDELIAVPY